MRTITAEEYGSLIDEIARLQKVNAQITHQNQELNQELNLEITKHNTKKPLEFSQKLIIATVTVAIFVIVSTFVLAFLDKEYPTQLVNDIITLTLTAEGGYFCQNGVRSIFTGDKTITNLKGNE